jgi:hypothetical protein
MKSILLGLLFSVSAFGAVSPEIRVEGALRMPLPNRLEALEKEGLAGRRELKKIAFDKKETLENRWRALTAYGRIYKSAAQPVLEQALASQEWFMRNAALIVVSYGQRQWAVKWARLLMHDPALVVRTAAVQTLRQLNAVDTTDLLWEKLYSAENYRSGQSLWIRRHILEALVQFAGRGQEGKFIRVLSDKDTSLHTVAVRGLEKVTRERFSTPDQWQAWWNNRKVL